MTCRLSITMFLIFAAGVLAAAAGGDWMTQVPARDRQKTNPYHDQLHAIQAGQLLFAEHCAECHGDHAQGTRKRPSLRTVRIQSVATEGDVHWFLVNGNVRRGMPSWSRLPDQQLWQLVSYLRSLKTEDTVPPARSEISNDR
jgi:mono/diheme cytochrome c family protein